MTTEYVMVPREATAQELRGVLGVALELLNECAGPMEVAAAVLESEVADDGLERLIERVKKFYADASLLQAAPPAPAMHASAPTGMKCADCYMDKEACPTCYSAWWKARHPHSQQMPEGAPPAPVAHSKSEYKRRVAMGDASILPPATVAVQPAPVAQALRDLVAVLREYGSFPPKLIPALLSAEQALASPSPAPVAELVVTDAQIDEREAFEAWSSSREDGGFTLDRYDDPKCDDYIHWGSQLAWEAWQARAILAAQSGAGTRGEKT